MARRLLPPLPSHLINGLSVGAGLAVTTGLVALLAGPQAAFAASSGASVVSVADTVAPPHAKAGAMRNAVVSSTLVALLVALTHHHPVWLGLTALLVTFSSIFWTAWGKRGGPQTFVMILTMVFQMAAYGNGRMQGAAAWQHLVWGLAGATAMALWAMLTGRVLVPRYRTLALADAVGALARLLREQAAWTAAKAVAAAPSPFLANDPSADEGLLALVRRQASIAEVFQQARDLLYSAPDTPHARRQAAALVHLVDMRDLSLVFQLDLEHLAAQAEERATLDGLAAALGGHARQLERLAWALRERHFPPRIDQEAQDAPGTAVAGSSRGVPSSHAAPGHQGGESRSPLAPVIDRRLQHLARHQAGLRACCALPPSAGGTDGTDGARGPDLASLASMLSPTTWSLATLSAHRSPRSPVMRHAARTTAAMACAYGLAQALPWTAHPHWLLMTVAVVLRGNLEQTLLRRNARVLGTLAGCAVAGGLLALHPPAGVMMGAMVIGLSLAHAYALVDYRITSAAGAVMALTQSHLALGLAGRWIAAERIADTLIGVAIAWAFSYLWPSWERAQLPRLVHRLVQAQLAYAGQVMTLPRPGQAGARLSHARREVYDVLWLLAQTLQRLAREPRHVRPPAGPLEELLVHSHRLVSHLASINALLTLRAQDLDETAAQPALARAQAELVAMWGSSPPASSAPARATEPPPRPEQEEKDKDAAPVAGGFTADDISQLPDPHGNPTPWLLRRLALAGAEARALAAAAAQIRPTH